MDDWIKLLTAVLGLITAIVVYNKTKTKRIADKQIVNMGDDFKGLKSTVNVVGTISLIMVLYFGFIILMAAFPRIFSFALGINSEKQTKQVNTTEEKIRINENISNNQLAFEAIKLMESSTKRDAQFIILIDKSLITEENEVFFIKASLFALSSPATQEHTNII
jgi:ABC-type uncharacterized transport system fused permease/ATPase subunit